MSHSLPHCQCCYVLRSTKKNESLYIQYPTRKCYSIQSLKDSLPLNKLYIGTSHMVSVMAEETVLQENFINKKIMLYPFYLNFYYAAIRVLVISRDVIMLVLQSGCAALH